MPYAYRKNERLRKNSEFASVMKGKRLSLDGLSLFYSNNETGNFKVGISVGKKLGNAVTRNRIRRRIRVSIMKALGQTSAGYDLVFVARRELAADSTTIMKVVEALLRRTSILQTDPKARCRDS
jgi:ribonuclease P protein component